MIDKPLAKITKRKRRKTQINTIRDGKGDDPQISLKSRGSLSTILKKYILMYKFLGTYNLPKLNKGAIKNLNRSITTNEIEAELGVSITRSPGPDGVTANFYQVFREEIEKRCQKIDVPPIFMSLQNIIKWSYYQKSYSNVK